MGDLVTARGTLVLGMHRSGTSALTRVLSILLGHSLDPLLVASNPQGQWERLELRPHLDRLLIKHGATWDFPPATAIDWKRTSDPRAAAALLSLGDDNWVWKDPRLCLTLPFWLPHLRPEPRLVLTTRDPLQIAHSLAKRDGRTVEHGLALWEQTLRTLIQGLAGRQVYVVSFAELRIDPDSVTTQLSNWLGSASTGSIHEAASSIVASTTPDAEKVAAASTQILSSQQLELISYLARPQGETSFELPLPAPTPNLVDLLGKPSLARKASVRLRDLRSQARQRR